MCGCPRRNPAYETARALQNENVLHVRVRAKTNPRYFSIGLGQAECAVARDLVLLLVVNQLFGREPTPVLGHDNDVLARNHVARAVVVGAVPRSEYRILRSRRSKESYDRVLEFHSRIVIEEVRRVRVHLSAVDSQVCQNDPRVVHHLVR